MNTPLHKAAFLGDEPKVIEIIGQGSDLNALNKDGSTPLHSALFFPPPSFFASGFDLRPNHMASAWNNSRDHYCLKAKFRIAKLLMDKGSDAKIANKHGLTPFDIAPAMGVLALHGLLTEMQWLVSLDGARWDPTALNEDDQSLLHAAAFCGSNYQAGNMMCAPKVAAKAQTIQWLCALGCDKDKPDKKGVTAVQVCTVEHWNPTLKWKEYIPAAYAMFLNAMNGVSKTVLLSKNLPSDPCGIALESLEGVVVVKSVTPGLPAEKAGIKVDDRVFSIAREKVGRAPEATLILQRVSTWTATGKSRLDPVEAVIEVAV